MIDDYASPKQLIYLKAIEEHGSIRKAAVALGMKSDRGLRESMKQLRKKAAISGYAPEADMVHKAPEPFIVKGVSTYYDKEGQPAGQWVKTSLDQQQYLEAIKGAIGAFYEELPPLIRPLAPAANVETDIIPWIQIGDAHLGMIAYESETGNSFDISICEREICAAFAIMVAELPGHYERIVVNDLGDFTHYENMGGVTEASRHALDCDGRFSKMIKSYSRIMRFIIELVSTKADTVDVIINQGNHSRTNDFWMAELLKVAYAQSNHVNILDNDSVFIGYRMGKTFVMTHHSDKCKPANLANVMTTDFKEDYGQTDFHYIDIGHIHHGMVMKEHPNCTVESWNQLANHDKWAFEFGYRSRQSISVVYRSRTYGEVGRKRLPIERVRDMVEKAHGGTYQPQRKLAYVA
jgi:hypothetical protein